MFCYSKKALTRIKTGMETLTEEELMVLVECEDSKIAVLNKMLATPTKEEMLADNMALIDAALILGDRAWFEELTARRRMIES